MKHGNGLRAWLVSRQIPRRLSNRLLDNRRVRSHLEGSLPPIVLMGLQKRNALDVSGSSITGVLLHVIGRLYDSKRRAMRRTTRVAVAT